MNKAQEKRDGTAAKEAARVVNRDSVMQIVDPSAHAARGGRGCPADIIRPGNGQTCCAKPFGHRGHHRAADGRQWVNSGLGEAWRAYSRADGTSHADPERES